MLLIITNSRDATADYLVQRLHKAGVRVVRFNTDRSLENARLQYDLSGPRLHLYGAWYGHTDFSNVWYRRPERLILPGESDSPESRFILDEWSEALEGFFAHIPRARWMNHPVAEAAASQKLEQLSRACSLGFTIPDTLVTQEPEELRNFFRRHTGRLIAKPMGRGHIERITPDSDTVIFTNRVREEHLNGCEDLRGCPTLFQEEVRKQSDIRITVVDDAIHAVEMSALDGDGMQRCDIRRDSMQDVAHKKITLPDEVRARVRSLMKSYGLRFAAIDMAVADDGRWVFFEVNPNGQWAWMDLKEVTDIASSFLESFS